MLITHENAPAHEIHSHEADASSLGFKPGQPMPRQIETNLGNRQPFILEWIGKATMTDISHWTYRQGNGCLKLTIYND